MTTNTTRAGITYFTVRALNRFNNFLMTLSAGPFSYFISVFRDPNVVFKPTRREIVRMPKTVARFGRILSHKVWRRVTVVADGDVAVAGLHPSPILLLHHMTISACLRIVGEVRIALGVDKSVGTNT